jgi:general secretion pathway protein C
MNVVLRKYFWIFNLLVITACAYFVASSIHSCAMIGRPWMSAPKRALRSSRLPAAGLRRSRDVTGILARNIFCSSCEPAAEVAVKTSSPDPAAGGAPVAGGAAVKSTLNLQLIATLVSDQDKKWSYAALLHPDDNKTRLYGIGKKLVGIDATIVDVRERRVLLSREGRTEYIDLGEGGRRRIARAKPRGKRPRYRSAFSRFTKNIAAGVKKIGPNKYEIKRSALNKVLGNTTMLARSARIVPSVRNGKPNGFKLYAIRPGSVYSLIGMQNGDTIHAINGRAITTPDKALAVYTKVRTASHLTIAFTRRGKAVTHDYTIR